MTQMTKILDALTGGRSLAELDRAVNAHRQQTDEIAAQLLSEETQAAQRIYARATAHRREG